MVTRDGQRSWVGLKGHSTHTNRLCGGHNGDTARLHDVHEPWALKRRDNGGHGREADAERRLRDKLDVEGSGR